MTITERVPLASLTTFRIGGPARFVAECSNEDDIEAALAFARERGLPFFVLGGGSNTLASDEGFEGVIIRPMFGEGPLFEDQPDGRVLLTAGAGAAWDALAASAAERGLWGIENLSGIPGTLGGAVVQNIGAYGAALSQTFAWAEAFDTETGSVRRFLPAAIAELQADLLIFLGRHGLEQVELRDHQAHDAMAAAEQAGDAMRVARDHIVVHFKQRVRHQLHPEFLDLVDDLEGEVRRLLAYLGLPFEESCLRFFESDRPVRTPSSEQVRQPINRSGIGKWRRYEPWIGELIEAVGDMADEWRR